ncbi:MAG: glycosyltransferase family 2 protein [Armatimonadota bacterium]
MSRRRFSILVPVYFNEPNIRHTVPRLKALEQSLPDYDLEFVFVDDGSGDASLELLLEERRKDPRVKVVKLSRNFGSMAAIQAGLHYVTGDCVGIIAADLQDPPELFVDMVDLWEKGNKVVLAVRQDRKESLGQRMFAGIYYYLLDRLALRGYPRGGFDFLLVDRQIVDELNAIREKNTNVMSLVFWLGHARAIIPYTRGRREHGVSRWTLAKKIKLFVDSFVSFSFAPIRIMTVIGLITAGLSFAYGLFVIIALLTGHVPVRGYTTIVSLITFLLGLIMIMLGIVGEYLWRILDESRNRPNYVVDEVYE